MMVGDGSYGGYRWREEVDRNDVTAARESDKWEESETAERKMRREMS